MKPTGERLIPDSVNETLYEHLHRYALALEYVENKIILDIASGEGYGSNLLAQKAKQVYGVDISKEVIEHATLTYKQKNLKYLLGEADKIPLSDNSIEVVVSFETIEHHDKHEEMMQELKRVLIPGGLLIISSPDKKYYTDEPGFINKFHVKELYSNEFKQLISTYFRHIIFINQKLSMVSVLAPQHSSGLFKSYNGNSNLIESVDNLDKPVYNLILASDIKIEKPATSIMNAEEIIVKQKKQITELIALNKYNSNLIKLYKNSKSYKIGNLIVKPLSRIKSLFS